MNRGKVTNRNQSPLWRNSAFWKSKNGDTWSLVGGEVGGDLLVGERRALVGPPARVPDLCGYVADDEDDLVAHALEAAEDQHRDGVAEVDLRAGGVDAELRHEGPPLAARFDNASRQVFGGWLELLATSCDEGGLLGGGEIGQVRSPALVGHFKQLADHGRVGEVGADEQLARP